MEIFNDINENDLEKLYKLLNAKIHNFTKDNIILNNVHNLNMLGVILEGKANLIRVDYNGNKSIIEILKKGDVFDSKVFGENDSELFLISETDTKTVTFDYNIIFNSYAKNHTYHIVFIHNLLKVTTKKLSKTYERIRILTKTTTREKLLEYFNIISIEKSSKTFTLPMSYTALSEYLSVNRSALMREIKNLKDDNIIKVNGKRITRVVH